MGILTEWITDWLKELLIGGIMGNLEGLFETVNTRVGEIEGQVGMTPAALERRGYLLALSAFRNGDPADCQNGPDLCCNL